MSRRGRDAKWLVPHSHVAVENPEGYLSCRGARGEGGVSIPRRVSPAQSISSRKKGPHNISVRKSAGILSAQVRRKVSGSPGTLLKGQCTKSHLWTLTLGFKRRTGGRRVLELHSPSRERKSCVALGRGHEGQPPMPLC